MERAELMSMVKDVAAGFTKQLVVARSTFDVIAALAAAQYVEA